MASVTDAPTTLSEYIGVPPMPVCRLGVEQYEQMIRAGIITKDDRIELLDGWLVPKVTHNPPHILALELVRDALQRLVPEGWCVWSQGPVRIGRSMPEPDVMVIRGTRRQYRDRRMTAADVGLIVEVADASLTRDQVFKKAIYAQAGIPVYWLVNLIDQRIEAYSDPAGADESANYRQRRDYSPADQIPLILDGRSAAAISVRELLP